MIDNIIDVVVAIVEENELCDAVAVYLCCLLPCIELFEYCTGTVTPVSTYTSTLLYRVAGVSTLSHGELYSPSTTS